MVKQEVCGGSEGDGRTSYCTLFTTAPRLNIPIARSIHQFKKPKLGEDGEAPAGVSGGEGVFVPVTEGSPVEA
jgi:hypothetical protein